MMTGKGYDERGVIGLAEPPVVSPGAAISNAVANAIGVRVPFLPLTPDRVLEALEQGGAHAERLSTSLPSKKEQVATLLGEQGCHPRRRHRSAGADEGRRRRAQAPGQHQAHRRIARHHLSARQRPAHRRADHHRRTGRTMQRCGSTIRCCRKRQSKRPVRRFATWQPSAATCASVRAAGTSATAWDCWPRPKTASRWWSRATIATPRSSATTGRRTSSVLRPSLQC